MYSVIWIAFIVNWSRDDGGGQAIDRLCGENSAKSRSLAAVAASYISFRTPDIKSKLEDSIFTRLYGTNNLMINNRWYLSNPTVPSFSAQDSNILKPIFGVTGL